MRIVGIGASAGGLESLEQLFGALPPQPGFAFVVVQHLSPDFRSLMDELISRHSSMPVIVATDGMAVEENHIYLMPPRVEMIIRDGRLVLADKPQQFSLPIDVFLRSLALDAGKEAIAVILSGSGTDGSRGIVEVDRAGGLVLVESPESAKFDGMPTAAIETGVADHVRTPGDLARVLCGLEPLDADPSAALLSDDPLLDGIFRLLRDAYGIDFSLYKTSTVGRRIQRRIDLLASNDLRAYHDLLHRDPQEVDALYRDLLIGVTEFFRDPEAFAALDREVVTPLVEQATDGTELRVWVAGCATGEEAYSIAIMFHEAITRANRSIALKVLATDVHHASLEHAGQGIYGEERLANVSPERLARYFTRRPGSYQVVPELRALLVFARHNITKDPPFTKMALITCRNLLIYLQPNVQHTAMSLFHFGLALNGVLFLGASESPGLLADEFVTIDDHWKLYRKRRDVHLLSQMKLPLPIATPRETVPRGHGLLLATYDQLLDRFMPRGFLVDENRVLVDCFAGAENLLQIRPRRPTTSLVELLPEELRAIAGSAIQRSLTEGQVSYSDVVVNGETTTLEGRRLEHPRAGVRYVVLTFRAQIERSTSSQPSVPMNLVERERMGTLESELVQTREALQTTIEELETSNEEMQATNEELVAANEELQSTNEELHSVNEELYTVNAEHQHKIIELKELAADMQHLLDGTDVGTIFLDADLRIRRFTSRIAGVFRFQRHDVGRELADFSHNIDRETLLDEIAEVRRTGNTIEDEVRDHQGTPYFLRILPYRVGQVEEPAGVVLTLTDISALEAARSRLAQLSAIVESSEDAIVGKALDGTITAWNRGAENLYGYTANEVLGKNVAMLADDTEDELPAFVERIRRGEKIEHVRSARRRKDGKCLEVSVTISPIYNPKNELAGISAIARDISALVAATRELEDGAQNRERFLAMLSHELRNPLAAVINAAALLQDDEALVKRCQPVIARQAKHMKRLLDDLLDVSRITRGKFGLQLADIDLRDVIDAAIETTAPLVADRQIDLRVSLPRQTLPVRADHGRLVQVFGNLITNACNYSPAGTRADLVVDTLGDRVQVVLRDHGFGIAPEMLPRIFELFVQSEQRLDRSHGGLGVGLSLAKNIVDLHEGEITATSEGANRGTELRVVLPLRAAIVEHDTPAMRRKVPERRIVLVDDQDDAREMLRMLLESRHHEVMDAGDGNAAIELIAREKPDIAFIDIGMPVMTGLEVAQKIRENHALDGVFLVALTGYGAASDLEAARAAGFDNHLIKPADLGSIEQILATLGN